MHVGIIGLNDGLLPTEIYIIIWFIINYIQ